MDVEIGLAEALCPGSRTYILQKFCQKLAEDCRSVVRSLQTNVEQLDRMAESLCETCSLGQKCRSNVTKAHGERACTKLAHECEGHVEHW